MSKSSSASPIMTRGIIAAVAVAILVPLTGCNLIRTFDETAALTYRDFVWARRAYNLRFGNCDRPYSEHFENGFCAGYADICNGGDGYVPALPPEDYRGYEFQSTDGARCVNAWFEGYPAGVAAAKQDKAGSYHDVMISRMVNDAVKQSKTEAKLPADVSVVPGKQSESNQTKKSVGMPMFSNRMAPSVLGSVKESEPFNVPAMAPIVPAKLKFPLISDQVDPIPPGARQESESAAN